MEYNKVYRSHKCRQLAICCDYPQSHYIGAEWRCEQRSRQLFWYRWRCFCSCYRNVHPPGRRDRCLLQIATCSVGMRN